MKSTSFGQTNSNMMDEKDEDFVMTNGMSNNGRRSSSDLSSGSKRTKRPLSKDDEMTQSSNKKMRTNYGPHHKTKTKEKKKQELNNDNIWKQRNIKIRRDYFCRTSPTLVISIEIDWWWKCQVLTDLENIKVERFKGLPIAKVLFGTSNDVKKALQDKEIRIGYRL
ncbi:hypothetical protein RFI_39172, partial [Reticulomyxa filosa]